MEQTLIIVKPDGVKRGLVEEIVGRFKRSNFRVVKTKNFRFNEKQAREFYLPHVGKAFFEELVSFTISGSVFAAVIEGPDAVAQAREIIGPTDPAKSPQGTVRGDFGTGITTNIIHASDSHESFSRESKIIFG